jgi:hypothetical protein
VIGSLGESVDNFRTASRLKNAFTQRERETLYLNRYTIQGKLTYKTKYIIIFFRILMVRY